MRAIRSLLLFAILLSSSTLAFVIHHDHHNPERPPTIRQRTDLFLAGKPDNNSNSNISKTNNKKRGYQFGDISKSLFKSATGKDYEFGDLSRYLDQRAKESINSITGRGHYQFGDLTRWVDAEIKGAVNSYTNKQEYRVGDITAEIIRRTWTGQYDLGDVVLAVRVLVSTGVAFTPLGQLLPLRVLMAVVNANLANDVGGRALEEAVKVLEGRLTALLSGSSHHNNPVAGYAKDEVMKQVRDFCGKQTFDDYKVGDMTNRALALANSSSSSSTDKLSAAFQFSEKASKALDVWDKKYLEESSGNHKKVTNNKP